MSRLDAHYGCALRHILTERQSCGGGKSPSLAEVRSMRGAAAFYWTNCDAEGIMANWVQRHGDLGDGVSFRDGNLSLQFSAAPL